MMYKIIIKKVDYIKKGKRTYKKFTTLKSIPDVPKKDLSKKTIEINRLYRDWCYIIDFKKQ